MQRAICLGIIHRNRLIRECLASVLSAEERFRVVDIGRGGSEYLRIVQEERPDVVLIDLGLPEQLPVELTQQVREHAESTKVILLVPGSGQENLAECIAAGAHGCVLEETSLDGLQDAIERVVRGEMFCSPEIVHSMFQKLAQTARVSDWRERIKSVNLTPRELEIVHLIDDGLSNKQIARKLSLSLYTVKNHVHNIIEKLQVEDRQQAVQYARQHKWLRKSGVSGRSGSGS